MISSDIQHQLIEKSIAKGISYQEYRSMVKTLAENGSTTGTDPENSALIDYTKLNDRRMNRLDKTTKIPADAIEKIKAFNRKTTWLIITESWCGDAAQTMPVMNKIAELNANIDIKIVLRDENEALMDRFLTNGGKSIPILIMVDDEINEVLHRWGPRPSEATKMVADYKALHGKLTPEFKQELQVWYNKDKGQNTIDDLLELLLS